MAATTKVVKYFIKNSPVGELNDILEDISTMIGHDFLTQPDIKNALRDYYEAHLQHVQVGDRVFMVDSKLRQEPIVRYAA